MVLLGWCCANTTNDASVGSRARGPYSRRALARETRRERHRLAFEGTRLRRLQVPSTAVCSYYCPSPPHPHPHTHRLTTTHSTHRPTLTPHPIAPCRSRLNHRYIVRRCRHKTRPKRRRSRTGSCTTCEHSRTATRGRRGPPTIEQVTPAAAGLCESLCRQLALSCHNTRLGP